MLAFYIPSTTIEGESILQFLQNSLKFNDPQLGMHITENFDFTGTNLGVTTVFFPPDHLAILQSVLTTYYNQLYMAEGFKRIYAALGGKSKEFLAKIQNVLLYADMKAAIDKHKTGIWHGTTIQQTENLTERHVENYSATNLKLFSDIRKYLKADSFGHSSKLTSFFAKNLDTLTNDEKDQIQQAIDTSTSKRTVNIRNALNGQS
jgi:hypothetical protein